MDANARIQSRNLQREGSQTRNRIPKPKWLNRRLITGVVLILVAIVAGNFVFMKASATQLYYMASTTISPGQPITDDVLTLTSVKLGDAASSYIAASSKPIGGSVAVETIGAGELIGRASIAAKNDLELRVLSIALDTPVPSSLVVGATGDVWISEPTTPEQKFSESNVTDKPSAGQATGSDPMAGKESKRVTVTIRSIKAPQGLMTGAQVLEITCHKDDVAALIEAASNKSKLTLVASTTGK